MARDPPPAQEVPNEGSDEDMEADEALADLDAFDRLYANDRSWEDVEEDEFGRLRALDPTREQRAKRKRLLNSSLSARIRRGMIRYFQIVVDLSIAAASNDYRPSRLAVVYQALEEFIAKFFDENPLSHLGIIVLHDGLAHRLTELSSSPKAHIDALRGKLTTSGVASLQNGLELAKTALAQVPPYGHREALVLFSALTTCDPGDVMSTVAALKKEKCRVSVVGVGAEVYVLRHLADNTGGTYVVSTDENHLRESVLAHATPPPELAENAASQLVRMGFPRQNAPDAEYMDGKGKRAAGGYTCPQCKTRVTELPAQCPVCTLTLVSSPHLARSYHHLLPVQTYAEVSADEARALRESRALVCYGCACDMGAASGGEPAPGEGEGAGGGGGEGGGGVKLRCPKCRQLFCFECDVYVHESLHNCPGCEAGAGDGGGEGGGGGDGKGGGSMEVD